MLTPPLSLDCLTLGNITPAALIKCAATAGYELVSLWLQEPSVYPAQIPAPGDTTAIKSLLNDTGIRVHTIEAFDLTTPADIRACRPALERGAELGAGAVLAIHRTEPDRAAVAEALACLCEMTGKLGMTVNIEPIAMGYTRTLAAAHDLIRDARADAGIIFDAWHFIRAGSGIAELSGPAVARIRHVQICDGAAQTPEADWPMEAAVDRLHPGEGRFPLRDMIAALPRNVTWAIEAPSLRRTRAGIAPAAQAIETYAALRQLLANAPGAARPGLLA